MSIKNEVALAINLVAKDANHDLRPSSRCRIRTELAKSPPDTVSKLRENNSNGHLAKLCVEKVLPIWIEGFPSIDLPEQCFSLMNYALADNCIDGDLERILGKLWIVCDDLVWNNQNLQTNALVGYASIQMVRETASSFDFFCSDVRDETTNIEIDPSFYDTAFLAAAAYSGGMPWDEQSDSQRRFEFWNWWLEKVATIG